MYYKYYMGEEAVHFWERINNLMNHDLNQAWLARETGLSPVTISSWKKNFRLPPADRAVKIAKALGVSVEFLVTGEETEEENEDLFHILDGIKGAHASNQEISSPQNDIFIKPNQREYVLTDDEKVIVLPVYGQKVSAGYGEDLVNQDIIPNRHITVMKRLVAGFDSGQLRAVEVFGDSMTGISLFHGDTVIFVNDYVQGDGVYVILVNGEAMVKRLEFDPFDKKVRIHSENKNYATKEVPADSDVMKIQGKVVGWVHCHPY